MNVAPETPLRGRQMPMDDGETPPPVCPFWTQATQAQQILGPVAQVGEASPIEQDSRTCALRWDFFGYMINYNYMTYVCICICVPRMNLY